MRHLTENFINVTVLVEGILLSQRVCRVKSCAYKYNPMFPFNVQNAWISAIFYMFWNTSELKMFVSAWWSKWLQTFPSLLLLWRNDLHSNEELWQSPVFLWSGCHRSSNGCFPYNVGSLQEVHIGFFDSTWKGHLISIFFVFVIN